MTLSQMFPGYPDKDYMLYIHFHFHRSWFYLYPQVMGITISNTEVLLWEFPTNQFHDILDYVFSFCACYLGTNYLNEKQSQKLHG